MIIAKYKAHFHALSMYSTTSISIDFDRSISLLRV